MVEVAPKVQVADVMFNLAGRVKVVVSEKNFTRTQTTFDCFLVTAQHRKRDEFADACRCGSLHLSETLKPPLRIFEFRNRQFHLSADEGLKTRGPGSQGFDF